MGFPHKEYAIDTSYARPTGFEPAIFAVTERRVNRATPRPQRQRCELFFRLLVCCVLVTPLAIFIELNFALNFLFILARPIIHSFTVRTS
jgi:hypothetical protein